MGAFANLAFLQPFAAVREELANALLAEVDALLGELDGGGRAVREQRGGLAAHALAHVVPVGLLQALDGLGVFEQRDLLAQGSEFRFEDCHSAVVVDDPAVGDDRVRVARAPKAGSARGRLLRVGEDPGLHGVSCTESGRRLQEGYPRHRRSRFSTADVFDRA